MLIKLSDFKEGEITPVHRDYDPKKLDLEFVDMAYTESVQLKGTVEKSPETLNFSGELKSQIEQTCGRCLKVIREDLHCPFEFFYETKDKDTIDTTDDLRETLILDHPLSFLCKEDCCGLCPQCGVNWNEKKCRCSSDKPAQNPFSVLKSSRHSAQKEKHHGKS